MSLLILGGLIEPLQYSFMQRSLLIAILVGLTCAVVGSYLMVQRLALLGDAISHSVLPGLAIAYILGLNIFIGAFMAGVLSTVVITWIRTRSPIKEDAAMGIVFSCFFALGITLITVIQKETKIDLNHFFIWQHSWRHGGGSREYSGDCRDYSAGGLPAVQRIAVLYL